MLHITLETPKSDTGYYENKHLNNDLVTYVTSRWTNWIHKTISNWIISSVNDYDKNIKYNVELWYSNESILYTNGMVGRSESKSFCFYSCLGNTIEQDIRYNRD